MTVLSTVDLSVIVVSYNTRELLERCLESVGSTAPASNHEIIVVDNGSIDGSADVVARYYPGVRLLRNQENVGFSRANNQAIRESRGRYILLLNSDAELLPGAVDVMVDFMESYPEAGVIGAQLVNQDGSFQPSFADFPTLRSELLLVTGLSRIVRPATYPFYPLSKSTTRQEVDWVSGACMMVRRSVISTVGPLDEGYFMYSEETDWCFRVRDAGWRVYYVPDARAVHWSGKSSDTVPEVKRSRLYRSKLLFLKKHRGAAVAGAYSVVLYGASLAKLAGWALAILDPRQSRRRRAVRNVRSYLSLIGGV